MNPHRVFTLRLRPHERASLERLVANGATMNEWIRYLVVTAKPTDVYTIREALLEADKKACKK